MTNTFIWIPDNGATESHAPSIDEAAFGDSYSQRSNSGLNPDMQDWSGISFSGRGSTEINAIVAFLDAQGAAVSFNWTPPRRSSALFVCKKWSRKYVSGTVVSVTADFKQVPA
jgi:phage-related protein